jgi:signal transduction histidine kinase
VNVNELVEFALLRIQFPRSASIELEVELDESIPPVFADPEQMIQILSNLFLNAVQAMPQGGTLTVKTGATTRQEKTILRSVSITISDTGVGIPKENLEKVFDPLFSTKAHGIGLGLALVKTLLEGHNAKIKVQSEGITGRGSSFIITLPEAL